MLIYYYYGDVGIMKVCEKEILRDYLTKHKLVTLTDYWAFYREFSKYEVNSVKSFRNSYKSFYNFLMRNIDLQASTLGEKLKAKEGIDRASNYLESQISGTLDPQYQRYVGFVNELLSSPKNNVLDVGAGSMPGSSILLGETHRSVTSMDRTFDIAPSSLKKMNVQTKEEFFSDDTDISSYDAVTGRHPCSAILSMVRSASKANKPYIIALCDCEKPTVVDVLNMSLPDMDKIDVTALLSKVTYDSKEQRLNVEFGWKDILPMYDSSAKVVGEYVTNLDISSEDLLKYLSKYSVLPIIPSLPKDMATSPIKASVLDIRKGKVPVSVDGSRLSTINIVRESNDRGSSYWHLDREDYLN